MKHSKQGILMPVAEASQISTPAGQSNLLVSSPLVNSLSRYQDGVFSLMLFSLVIWADWPALQGDFIHNDDFFYILSNSHVNTGLRWENIRWAFLSLEMSNWHPLTWLSHMLDCQFYGLRPWGHHLTSVLFHAANTALAFLVMRRLTGAVWRSLAVAALFGLHPLRVESVAWICERKDVLSVFFALLTLWAYMKYVKDAERRPAVVADQLINRKSSIVNPFYLLALLLFIAGLMSKTMVASLPGVLLLLDYWPLRRRYHPGLILEKLPFVMLALIASILEYNAQHMAGRMSTIAGLSLADQLGNALVAYCRYLGKFFWPANLCAFYPHPGHWPAAIVALCAVLVIGISAVAFGARRRTPWFPVGWAWFLGTLVPAIGLVQVGEQAMADRYMYFPSLGLLIVLIWGAGELQQRWQLTATGFSVAGVAALIVCIGLTRHQIGYWKDDITVLTRAIEAAPNNYVAHENLSYVYFERGNLDAAQSEAEDAVQEKPDSMLAQYSLAFVLGARKQFGQAVSHFQKALELQPDYDKAHLNLGLVLLQLSQWDEAERHFQKVLKMDPNEAEAHDGMGVILFKRHQVAEAIQEFKRSLELDPSNADAQANMNYTARLNQPGNGQPPASIKP